MHHAGTWMLCGRWCTHCCSRWCTQTQCPYTRWGLPEVPSYCRTQTCSTQTCRPLWARPVPHSRVRTCWAHTAHTHNLAGPAQVRELNERCQKLALEAVYTTVQRHDDEGDEQQAEQQQAEEGDGLAAAVDSMQQQPEAGMQTTDRFEEVPCYDRCCRQHAAATRSGHADH
jgi:hypothetical protein